MVDKMLRIPALCFIFFQFISLAAALICSFPWAIELGHVEELFPYISYAGSYPPESCVFSYFMVIFSVSTLFAMCVRWRVVCDTGNCCLNTAAIIVGILADEGLLIVATFQVTNQRVIHWIGAVLTFACGLLYMVLQTFISYRVKTVPRFHNCLWITRLVLSALAILSAIVFIFLTNASRTVRGAVDTDSKWYSWEKGYELHVAAAFLELTTVVIFILFFLSFSCEFARLKLEWSVVVSDDRKIHPETEQVQRQTCRVNGGFADIGKVAENGINSAPK